MKDKHLNWWLLGVFVVLCALLYWPRLARCQLMPMVVGIHSNARWDNALFCSHEPHFGQDCLGGWLGLYVDKAGNKHPDAHYADLRNALAGIPDEPAPSRPPGDPIFGHPKFRCIPHPMEGATGVVWGGCGTGGWAWQGWQG